MSRSNSFLHKNQGLVTVEEKPNLEVLVTCEKGRMETLTLKTLRAEIIQTDNVLPETSCITKSDEYSGGQEELMSYRRIGSHNSIKDILNNNVNMSSRATLYPRAHYASKGTT